MSNFLPGKNEMLCPSCKKKLAQYYTQTEPDDILSAWVTSITRFNKYLEEADYSKYCTVSSKAVHAIRQIVHLRKADITLLKLVVNLFELEAIRMNWHVCESLGKYKVIFPDKTVFNPDDAQNQFVQKRAQRIKDILEIAQTRLCYNKLIHKYYCCLPK